MINIASFFAHLVLGRHLLREKRLSGRRRCWRHRRRQRRRQRRRRHRRRSQRVSTSEQDFFLRTNLIFEMEKWAKLKLTKRLQKFSIKKSIPMFWVSNVFHEWNQKVQLQLKTKETFCNQSSAVFQSAKNPLQQNSEVVETPLKLILRVSIPLPIIKYSQLYLS